MNPFFELSQQYAQMWMDFASQMGRAATSLAPDASPPQAARQARSAMFAAMSESAENMMRSPQFLHMLKQYMDGAMMLRRQMEDFMAGMIHACGGVARRDSDGVAGSVHHLETRVLDRLEELAARLDQIERRSNGSGVQRSHAGGREVSRSAEEPV